MAATYHLLTGAPLFPDSNQIAVISQHLTQPAPAPSTIRPELAPFDTAFARALAKDPKDRFPCCQDFARAITAAAAQSGMGFSPTAPTQEAPVPTVESAAAPTDRRSLALAIFVGAGLLGLVAAGVLLWRPWAERDGAQISTSTSTEPPTTAQSTPTTTTLVPSPPPVTSNPLPPPPPEPTTSIPATPTYPAAGALGEYCSNHGAIGTGADGVLYYCARVQYTDAYKWSLAPDVIPNPLPPLDIPPGSPCMVPGGTADAVGGTLWCKPNVYGGWTWQYGGPG